MIRWEADSDRTEHNSTVVTINNTMMSSADLIKHQSRHLRVRRRFRSHVSGVCCSWATTVALVDKRSHQRCLFARHRPTARALRVCLSVVITSRNKPPQSGLRMHQYLFKYSFKRHKNDKGKAGTGFGWIVRYWCEVYRLSNILIGGIGVLTQCTSMASKVETNWTSSFKYLQPPPAPPPKKTFQYQLLNASIGKLMRMMMMMKPSLSQIRTKSYNPCLNT